MSEAKIKITISKDGTVGFEVNGVSGSSCEDVTKVLMENLGVTESQTLKEEYLQILPDYVSVEG